MEAEIKGQTSGEKAMQGKNYPQSDTEKAAKG